MTVKDVMTLLESPDRVRVIKDGEEIYNQYFANMEVDKEPDYSFRDLQLCIYHTITI